MKSGGPVYKIELIERSQRCFACGIVGLVPFLGIPFAVMAIRDFLHLAFCEGPWNPARTYLRVGMICGAAGILLDLAIVGAIIINIT